MEHLSDAVLASVLSADPGLLLLEPRCDRCDVEFCHLQIMPLRHTSTSIIFYVVPFAMQYLLDYANDNRRPYG